MERDDSRSCSSRTRTLPQFPEFKPIDLDDWFDVESLTVGFPPSADFNFVEMWSWNRGEQGGWTSLNGNLVICWEDIVTGELFLTFTGANEVESTADALIDYAIAHGIDPKLQAIPESVLRFADDIESKFEIEDDLINADYLLSTETWSTLSGSRFKNKRNAIHRLERHHNPVLREIDLADPASQEQVLELCRRWAALRRREDELTRSEYNAIENLLIFATERPDHRLYAIGAYVESGLIGFSVNESLPDGYALGHFAKADIRFDGVYPLLLRQVGRYMAAQGIHTLNIEADLGDPGLAMAKKLCHPSGMLRKYNISRRSLSPESTFLQTTSRNHMEATCYP